MRILFVAFGLAGVALLILAVVFGYGKYTLSRDGVRSNGQVVGYFDSYSGTTETNPQPRRGHIFSPVIEFPGPGGEPLRITASTGSADPQPKLGTAVGVLYPDGRPAEAILDESQAIWGLTAAAAAFGLPFLLLGLFCFRYVR